MSSVLQSSEPFEADPTESTSHGCPTPSARDRPMSARCAVGAVNPRVSLCQRVVQWSRVRQPGRSRVRRGSPSAMHRVGSGLRYQEVRDDCQDQDYRNREDDASVHASQPGACPGRPKHKPDDDSREHCHEDARTNQGRTNRQPMRRAHRRNVDRTSPARQNRLRHPKDKQPQKDGANRGYRRARGAACLNGHVARLSSNTRVARR
ncbi:MAG: hypothetical protein JWR71_1605 [Pseudarthrobacter sp.]|nr:hypothetical protein [Pseudarthrobacter sp.]